MEERIKNARREYAALAMAGKAEVDAICEKYNLTDKEMWAMLFGIECDEQEEAK